MKVGELFRLDGRTAIVTGGAGHLGAAMVEALAEAGANVAVVGRELGKTRALASRVGTGNPKTSVKAFRIDVTDRAAVRRGFRGIVNDFGRLDILVNNAYAGASGRLESMSDRDWASALESGLSSAFRCTQEALPALARAGHGAVLNVGSMYGIVSPDPRIYRGTDLASPPNYGAAKGGLLQFTRYCAVHLAPYGIRVNALSPGPFPKPAVQRERWFVRELARKTPLGRIGRPEELKAAVVFLCSDASSYVTGHNLVVDGGWTAW